MQSSGEVPAASVPGRDDPGRGAAAIEGGATASCCKPSVGGVASTDKKGVISDCGSAEAMMEECWKGTGEEGVPSGPVSG